MAIAETIIGKKCHFDASSNCLFVSSNGKGPTAKVIIDGSTDIGETVFRQWWRNPKLMITGTVHRMNEGEKSFWPAFDATRIRLKR